MFNKNDVVQFNESHKWCGTFGYISEIKDCGENGIRYMIAVPISQQGTAFIFSMAKDQEFDYIGHTNLVLKDGDGDDGE